jgi:type VI secretion system secreted protein Hcp
MLACGNGIHYSSAQLTVRKAGGNPVEYIKVKIETVLISGLSNFTAQNDERMTEALMLDFAKVSAAKRPGILTM